jgi:hypothetical protein
VSLDLTPIDLSALRQGLRLLIEQETAKHARGEVVGISLARFEALSTRLMRVAHSA